jgi:acyl-CoA thioesterase-1
MSIAILALGDSYTLGEGVLFHQNYPSQLASKVFKECNKEVQLEVIAKTGWTSSDLLQELQDNKTRVSSYNFVFLLIGVNNQYQNKSLIEFQSHLNTLAKFCLGKSSENPQNIFWLSIPDYSVTPFAKEMNITKIQTELDNYNQIISELAKKYKFHMIDVTDISRNTGQNSVLLAEDQLHFSDKMYQVWVDRIFPTLKDLIS